MEKKWWLVIAGCITHAVNTGFSYFGMSAFFPSFEREFGWSRTAISGAFPLARVESGILGPIEGYLTDRIGAQRMLFIGLTICTLGFLSLSWFNSLPMLYVVIVVGIVLGSSLGYNMPISVLIAKVFHERRSLAGCFQSPWALRHMVTEGVSVHFVILLVDRGWSTETASGLLGLSALISAPARVGMGWLGDMLDKQLDKRRLMMGLLLALSFSVLLMGYTAVAIVFTPCMIIYSLAYGGLASLQEPIRADYFGTKAFATIRGVSRSVTTAGTFMGPIIAGFLYDLACSYTLAFAIFACVSLVSASCMFLAKPPKREKLE